MYIYIYILNKNSSYPSVTNLKQKRLYHFSMKDVCGCDFFLAHEVKSMVGKAPLQLLTAPS